MKPNYKIIGYSLGSLNIEKFRYVRYYGSGLDMVWPVSLFFIQMAGVILWYFFPWITGFLLWISFSVGLGLYFLNRLYFECGHKIHAIWFILFPYSFLLLIIISIICDIIKRFGINMMKHAKQFMNEFENDVEKYITDLKDQQRIEKKG